MYSVLRMNRLTQLVNQPESTFRISRNLISTVRSLKPPPSPPLSPLLPPPPLAKSPFSTCRRYSAVPRREMEPNSPENLSGSVIDDFVRVESPVADEEEEERKSSEIPNFVDGEVRGGGDGGGDNRRVDEEKDEQSSEIPNFVDVDGDNRRVDEAKEGQSSEIPNFVDVEVRGGGGDGDGDNRRVNYVVEEREAGESENAEEIMRNVVVLSHENDDGDNCNVYLVGTAHVSQESCLEVQAVIRLLKPQVVFLELCSSRVAILTKKDLKVPTYSEMIDMFKKKQNAFSIIYSWFLAKVAEKLEVLPGGEFRVAFEEAMKCGSKVILGDRPVNVTLRRTWNKMPLWHKMKLIYSMVFQAVFLPSAEDLDKMLNEMNDNDMLTLVIQEMSKEFPTLMETLVNERDRYMSAALCRTASEHTSVVAVVGKGHVQGIKRNWKQPIQLDDLMQIPSPGFSVAKVLSAGCVTVAAAAIIYGFISSKKHS